MMLFLFYRGVAVCRVGIAPGHTLLKKTPFAPLSSKPEFRNFPFAISRIFVIMLAVGFSLVKICPLRCRAVAQKPIVPRLSQERSFR
jgi:hypothetical protein